MGRLRSLNNERNEKSESALPLISPNCLNLPPYVNIINNSIDMHHIGNGIWNQIILLPDIDTIAYFCLFLLFKNQKKKHFYFKIPILLKLQ